MCSIDSQQYDHACIHNIFVGMRVQSMLTESCQSLPPAQSQLSPNKQMIHKMDALLVWEYLRIYVDGIEYI